MIYVYQTKYLLEEGENQYQKEHRIGQNMLQDGLEKWYGVKLSKKELKEQMITNSYGKPELKDDIAIRFNISHCDGVVICAFSEQEIGIDVERIQKFPKTMVKKILTEKEQELLRQHSGNEWEYKSAFYRFWTLKESYLKWKGQGFFYDPLQVEFRWEDGWNMAAADVKCSDQNVSLQQKMIDTEYVFAVCSQKYEEIKFENYTE